MSVQTACETSIYARPMSLAEQLAHEIVRDVTLCENGPWMLPESAVLPSGQETGTVAVIGVGGSTLRLTEVKLTPQGASSVELLSCSLPVHAKTGDLFAWCTAELTPVLISHPELAAMPLAVSWSFPIHNGKILSMGKSFTTQFNGTDLLEQFNRCLPLPYKVVSATHDGSSSLVSGIFESKQCQMALTLGTGLNINLICSNGTLVNTEVSMLGRKDTTPNIVLPTEPWDVSGPTPDFQPLEARTGGLWLGEMASLALGESVGTRDLWRILETKSRNYSTVYTIVERAAQLVAGAIYGLKMAFVGDGPLVIAYTGGVIFEPEFQKLLKEKLDEMEKTFGFPVEMTPEKYGSEVGTAIEAIVRARVQ